MTEVVVLYGTESGNSEIIAEDIVAEFGREFSISAEDLADLNVDDFDPGTFYLVVCSTHGDGGLPTSAQPFFELFSRERPDLEGVRYAVFGLGDSTYDTYSHGSEIIDELLTSLGASRVATYGRHDASSGDEPSDGALEWARDVLSEVAISV
jgi:MioC protein